MEDPMPKPPQAYGKLQDIKGLASPQSSPVRCSPGGAGLRSAAACGLALDIFPLQEHLVMHFTHVRNQSRCRFPSDLVNLFDGFRFKLHDGLT